MTNFGWHEVVLLSGIHCTFYGYVYRHHGIGLDTESFYVLIYFKSYGHGHVTTHFSESSVRGENDVIPQQQHEIRA